MYPQPIHHAGGANLPQPIPFVVPLPPLPERPQGPDGLPPQIEEPPLPGHFPLLGVYVGVNFGARVGRSVIRLD